MIFEEMKIELKDPWVDRTFIEELVIDQEKRIIHIFAGGYGDASLSPYVDFDYDTIKFSSGFDNYFKNIFNPESHYKGFNNHTDSLKWIILDLSNLQYSVPKEEREDFYAKNIRPLQVKVWIETWTWCFYSGGNTIYIFYNGEFKEIYIPRLTEQPQYLLDLLYSPYKERQVEKQNKYLRGGAGKF